jgi:trehalose 6-phosphate synthase
MENTDDEKPLIIIVSNRGPFQFQEEASGEFTAVRGSGGLVTALGALAQQHDVLWVAAALSESDRRWTEQTGRQPQVIDGISLRLIEPEPETYNQYYNEIANPLLWFIQHQLWDTPRKPSITRATWNAWHEGYTQINAQFATAVAASLPDTDRPVIILPQDYHLYLLPAFLREKLGERATIQPFIHIPWPGPDAWRILPGTIRTQMLNSLLQADIIGFQTSKDAFNFVQTCRFYLPDAHSYGSRDSISTTKRKVHARAYPISVDVEQVKTLGQEAQTKLLKNQLITFIGDRQLILRVDRIEPSKNILRGLEAFEAMLEAYPEHRERVNMLALLVPSRMAVDEYQDYLQEIMAKAGMINARFNDPFWEPIRIIVGDSYHRAIAAMQLYDVLLVNPIADGMNLVAKEGALLNQKNGNLLLSEHAGAFYELQEYAMNVSPFDVYGTAQALHDALVMPEAERQRNATGLRRIVEEADVQEWFQDQVRDALRISAIHASKAATSGTPSA